MKNVIHKFVQQTLLERTKFERETGVKYSVEDEILALATPKFYVGAPTHAFTMTDIEKVGINPRTDFNTPAGVYFYPLTKEYANRLFNGTLPFANNRKFVGIVKLQNFTCDSWLNFSLYSMNNFAYDSKLIKLQRIYPDAAMQAMKKGDHYKHSNAAKIFDITYFATKDTKRPTVEWAKLLRKLGFIGICDMGDGVVHHSEPSQIVCLSPAAYKTVTIYSTAEVRKTERVKTGDMQAALSMSKNPKTTHDKLLQLSTNSDIQVRCSVARNPATTNDILLKMLAALKHDYSFSVLYGIAQRSDLSREVMQIIIDMNTYKDAPPDMLVLLAKNKNASANILARLATSTHMVVRMHVANNPNITMEIAKKLSNDNELFVRSPAWQKVKELFAAEVERDELQRKESKHEN